MTGGGLINRFVRWLFRRRRIVGVKVIASRSDLPENLKGWLYVVGTERPKWAVLQCPCRCGEQIDVNLMTSRRPHWKLSLRDSVATLSPSLWMPESKCGSHFHLRDNRIDWAPARRRWLSRSRG